MKALTVCQPYAAALMGPKRIENRERLWNFRGQLLIHAGKSTRFMDSLNAAELATWPGYDPGKLRFGYIIGKVIVLDCVPYQPNHHTSPWACGPYCLITAQPMRLKFPFQYRGQLGLFDVPDALLKTCEWIPCEAPS